MLNMSIHYINLMQEAKGYSTASITAKLVLRQPADRVVCWLAKA